MDLKNLLKNGEDGLLTIYENMSLTLLPITLYKTENDIDVDVVNLISTLKNSSNVDKNILMNELKVLMNDVDFHFPKKTQVSDDKRTMIYKTIEDFSTSIHYIHARKATRYEQKSLIEGKMRTTMNHYEKNLNDTLNFEYKNYFSKGTRKNIKKPKEPKEVLKDKLDILDIKAKKNKRDFLYGNKIEKIIAFSLVSYFGEYSKKSIHDVIAGYAKTLVSDIVDNNLINNEILLHNVAKDKIKDELKKLKNETNVEFKVGKKDDSITNSFNAYLFLNDIAKGLSTIESSKKNSLTKSAYKEYLEYTLIETNNILNNKSTSIGLDLNIVTSILDKNINEYDEKIKNKIVIKPK